MRNLNVHHKYPVEKGKIFDMEAPVEFARLMVTSECGKSALRAPFDFQCVVEIKIKICFQYPNFVTREQYLNQNFFLWFQQSLHITFIYHMKLIFAPLFPPFSTQECDSRLESCCNIQPDQPEQQQDDQSGEVCSDANSACVMARFCYNGFIDQSAEHNAVRSPVSV